MVIETTASELGDVIIVRQVDPYQLVTNVIDWNVLTGLSNQYTVGKIVLTQGSTTITGYGTNFNLNSGDQIIVGNTVLTVASQVSPIHIELVNPAPFSTGLTSFMLPTNNDNQFVYEFRWSHTGEEFNEFALLTHDQNPGDLKAIQWDGTKPLWIDVKATVDRIEMASLITIIDVTFTLETLDGTIEECPQYCVDCSDPYSYSGCANIKPCVTDENIFKPYELSKNNALYRQLVEITTDIFGWDVRYYRTEPDHRTRDVIFMEYSLFNVVDQGNLKISVPDNEMPTQEIQYDMFGMGFEDFEIHIADYQFEKTFGSFKRPRTKDYLYFPKLNRMYEVKSVSLADEFNVNHTYWRVMLGKYQDRSAVIKDSVTETELENLVVGIEDIFGEEIKDEYTKVTKPQQLKTVSQIWEDGVRTSTNANIKIVDYDLKNRWTIVSKHHYDLSTVKTDEVALEYLANASQSLEDNLSFTMWVQPGFDTMDNFKYTLINGDQFGVGITARLSSSRLELMINDQPYTFMHNLIMSSSEWYAVVINLSNTFRQISVYIYHLNEQLNYVKPQAGNNNLELQFKEVRPTTQAFIWNIDRGYQLRGGKLKLTNLRVWKKNIEEEQHSNVLNQSLVRDAHLATVIDNATPSLSYQRYRNSR